MENLINKLKGDEKKTFSQLKRAIIECMSVEEKLKMTLEDKVSLEMAYN